MTQALRAGSHRRRCACSRGSCFLDRGLKPEGSKGLGFFFKVQWLFHSAEPASYEACTLEQQHSKTPPGENHFGLNDSLLTKVPRPSAGSLPCHRHSRVPNHHLHTPSRHSNSQIRHLHGQQGRHRLGRVSSERSLVLQNVHPGSSCTRRRSHHGSCRRCRRSRHGR